VTHKIQYSETITEKYYTKENNNVQVMCLTITDKLGNGQVDLTYKIIT